MPRRRRSSKSTVINLDELAALVHRRIERDNLTLRDAAQQAGVSPATLWRLLQEKGNIPDLETLTAITQWLQVPMERFLAVEPIPTAHTVHHSPGDTTPDIVEAHLRADKSLKPETARALAAIFRAIYHQFAEEKQKGEEGNRRRS